MMSKVKAVCLAGLVSLPFVVNAQPAAGDWDVSVGGTGAAQSDFKGSPASGPGAAFGANLSVGYFLNENVEAGVRQGLAYASTGQWTGSTRAFLDYNVLMDKLVPFIGANVGYFYGNRGQLDSWAFAPEAGLKYYIQEKAYLFGMAEYQMPLRGKTFKNGMWQLTVGIGLNL